MHDLVIRNGKIVDGTGRPAFSGDLAIDGDRLSAVGGDIGRGRRELDADGQLVTPGFVDAHTHYDGQVTWDPDLAPSSWHGTTTVVMGNCGVGFAPVRPDQHDFMIRVMEGVEEIPGAALEEGLAWDWESFPQYLDAVARQERTLDVVAQVPHCALRCYVMGEERALDDEARPEDIAKMAELTREALAAGALGFSTSRTLLHRIKGGEPVPGTHCRPEELLGIAQAFRDVGHGVFQMMSDHMGQDPDFPWMKAIAETTGRPLVFTLAQLPHAPHAYREVLAALENTHAEEGLDIRAGVPWRPPGVLLGLEATLNPFALHPSYAAVRKLPLPERVRALRDPTLRARLAAEETEATNPVLKRILSDGTNLFPLGDPPDYEPPASACVASRAKAAGVSMTELLLDLLTANEGRDYLYFPLSYVDRDFSVLHEMLSHPRSTASLSDGGAHVGSICDASVTSYMMSYWARDRQRGPQLPLEEVIRKQTSETAALYGLRDRGVVAPGKKADLNVVDFDGLRLHRPVATRDLPAGGRRLMQRAEGYRATVVSGQVIAEHGELTGARPGQLVRGAQA